MGVGRAMQMFFVTEICGGADVALAAAADLYKHDFDRPLMWQFHGPVAGCNSPSVELTSLRLTSVGNLSALQEAVWLRNTSFSDKYTLSSFTEPLLCTS
jgi:hypothetical protein